MRTRLMIGAAVLSLLVAACGGSTTEQPGEGALDAQTPAPAEQPATQPAPGPATIDVLAGSSSFGEILVGPAGLTLYGFTNDTQAASTCYGTCADAWPPVIVSSDWTAGPGLDFGIFATTQRDDGQLQLVAGQWPLYYFAGDAVPGDANGQGSGDVWFVVDTDGRLILDAEQGAQGDAAEAPAEEQAAAPVTVGSTALGDVLADEAGLTLYGFLTDTDGLPTCNDACADAWPPIIVDSAELPAGLDSSVFSVVPRDDGRFQLKAGVWPLYLFAGDAAPGDTNGQGSGDVWFAVAPDGSLIRPAGATSGTSDTGSTSGDGDY